MVIYLIRKQEDSDIPQMIEILKSCNMHHIPSPEMDYWDPEMTLVAAIGEKIVGLAGYRILNGEGKTTLAAIHPDYRGAGIATALHRRRCEELRALGCTKVVTNFDSPELIAAWPERFGYRRTGTVPKVHTFGREHVDHWVTMEAPLWIHY